MTAQARRKGNQKRDHGKNCELCALHPRFADHEIKEDEKNESLVVLKEKEKEKETEGVHTVGRCW